MTLAILAYHKLGEPSPEAWETWYYVPEETFAAQLRGLKDAGWEFVDAAALVEALSGGDLPERAALVTFDDGYRSVLRALPVMLELGCPGVVFVPTAYIGDRSRFDEETEEPVEPICDWDELRALERAGIAVQSHGVTHRTFSDLGEAELREELERSKTVLEQGLGKPVELFAFPYGDAGADPEAVGRLLESAGYRAACLFEGGAARLPLAEPYALARLPVWPDSDPAGELTEQGPRPPRSG